MQYVCLGVSLWRELCWLYLVPCLGLGSNGATVASFQSSLVLSTGLRSGNTLMMCDNLPECGC